MQVYIYTLTYHHAPSQDAVGSLQWDLSINNVYLCLSLCIGHDIAEIPGMPILIGWSTMLLPEGVEVRASTHAACSVVSKLVNVEAMCAWLEATHFTSHPGLSTILQGKNIVRVSTALGDLYGLTVFSKRRVPLTVSDDSKIQTPTTDMVALSVYKG